MKNILSIACSILLFTIFLSACGSNSAVSSSGSTIQKTPLVTPTIQPVTSTPISQVSTPTSSSSNASNCNVTYGCGVGSSNLTPYNGSGYTIDYPGSWVIASDGMKGNTFSAPDNSVSFHVYSPDASVNPLQYDFGTAAAQNCQVVKGGQQIVQSNNIDWQQSQYVCMPGDGSGKTEQVTILTSTATSYSIDYMTSQENFDNAYQVYFKPMVTSFKLQ